jgi:hypothetical protein
MAHLPCHPFRGTPLPLAALLLALAAAGCGDASGVGRTLPVAGRITLDGTPLTAATTVVLFKPDAARGNAAPWEPTGTVDAQGNYTLNTKGRRGAPPGWYKVTVTAVEAQANAVKGKRLQLPTPRSLVPARYGQAATTPLAVEVVENPTPDAYDLKLTGS